MLVLWFQTKLFTGLLEDVQLYKIKPIRKKKKKKKKNQIFTIYQNYTFALKFYFQLHLELHHVTNFKFTVTYEHLARPKTTVHEWVCPGMAILVPVHLALIFLILIIFFSFLTQAQSWG